MTSEAQHRANRENASRSTGPRTAAGKRRSRMNAVRHGGYLRHADEITAGLLGEQDGEIAELYQAIIADLSPSSALQYTQATHIAHQIINQQRVHRLTPSLAEADDIGTSLDDVIGRTRHAYRLYEELTWTVGTRSEPPPVRISYLTLATTLYRLYHAKLAFEPPKIDPTAADPLEAARAELLRIIEAVYGPLPEAFEQLRSRRDELSSEAHREIGAAKGAEAHRLLQTFERATSIHDRVARSIARDLKSYRSLKQTENELVDEDLDGPHGTPRNEPNPINENVPKSDDFVPDPMRLIV